MKMIILNEIIESPILKMHRGIIEILISSKLDLYMH